MSPGADRTVLRRERDGIVVTATIQDPATRNAMSDRLVAELEALLEELAPDRSIRALIVRGVEGLFCAGADLKTTSGDVRAANRRGGALFARLDALPQAVVAMVDGPAFGGGMGLACCADVVLAGPRARFALSETTLGLIPAQIAPFVVQRLGVARTRRLALTGERLDAAGALRLGLADETFEDAAEGEAKLTALLSRIGRCAPNANAATKALIRRLAPLDAGYAAAAADSFAACLEGEEGREGLAAFAAKRPPAWVAAQ